MKDKKRFPVSVVIMLVITIILLCFNLWATRHDRIYTSTFDECSDIEILETEFIKSGTWPGNIAYVTCRYVIKNNSDDDKTIRFIGMYPEDISQTILSHSVIASDQIYSVDAGAEKEITVTYRCNGFFEPRDIIRHEPDVYIIEA